MDFKRLQRIYLKIEIMKQYEIDNIKEQIRILEIDINDESITREIRDEMLIELEDLKNILKKS